MPYVDQGESQPKPALPIVPIAGILLAMAVGAALFPLLYNGLSMNQWLAPILTGVLVGCAMRFTSTTPLPKAGVIAILATLIACLVGYVVRHVGFIKWADPTFQPTVGHAFSWLINSDLFSIMLIAMAAYIAFTIGAAMPYKNNDPPPQAPSQ